MSFFGTVIKNPDLVRIFEGKLMHYYYLIINHLFFLIGHCHYHHHCSGNL